MTRATTFYFLIICFLLCSSLLTAQNMTFVVAGHERMTIQKSELDDLKTMKDINKGYPSSWILQDDYISTNISTTCNGHIMSALGSNENLNAEQQDILRNSDISASINVTVKYKTANAVTENIELNTMNFALTVLPATQAEYIGGQEALQAYLDSQAEGQIPMVDHTKFNDFPTVTFRIDKNGKATDIKTFSASDNQALDQLMIDTIKKMPVWKPAKNATGKNTAQSFKLIVSFPGDC